MASGEDRMSSVTWSAPPLLPFDLSSLVRPFEWALRKYRGPERSPMAYVLAPQALAEAGSGGVFGIDDDDATPGRFTAAPPPPGPLMADMLLPNGVPYRTADVPPRTPREVPVWGMLYPCTRSNLLASQPGGGGSGDPHRCAALREMRRHVAGAMAPLYTRLEYTRLPSDLAAGLAQLRVWPADATVDLGAGLAPVAAAQLQVCLLSFAEAAAASAGDCGGPA